MLLMSVLAHLLWSGFEHCRRAFAGYYDLENLKKKKKISSCANSSRPSRSCIPSSLYNGLAPRVRAVAALARDRLLCREDAGHIFEDVSHDKGREASLSNLWRGERRRGAIG
jgi:hypothetical protein